MVAVSNNIADSAGATLPGLAGAVPLREVGVVVLTGLATFVLLAVLSYSPFDSAWTYTSSHSEVRNMVGTSGAYAADVLLYLFGRMAYAIPLVLILFGVRLLVRRGEPWAWERVALRLTGALFALCALATLLELHWPAGDLPAGVGGVIGAAIAGAGLPLFHWVGLTLLLVTLLLVAVQATLGFSWLVVLESVGRGVVVSCGAILAGAERLRDRIDQWRELHRARIEAREQERIAQSVPGGSGFQRSASGAASEAPGAARASSAVSAAARASATFEAIQTSRVTPASWAERNTASRSSRKAAAVRWQWESKYSITPWPAEASASSFRRCPYPTASGSR